MSSTDRCGIPRADVIAIALPVLLFALGGTATYAQVSPMNESAKLLAADGASGDQFGLAVSISGDTAVVGSRLHDTSVADAGAAYVFVRSGTTWTERAKLVASDATVFDVFGHSVSISGDTVIVGSIFHDDKGIESGAAYVFVKPAGGWSGTLTESAKLLASDGTDGDVFGWSVSIAGELVVIGALEDDDNGFQSGSAYVFVKPAVGWSGTLNESAKLLPSDGAPVDFFGSSVAVSGNSIVVGTPNKYYASPGSQIGAAWLFERPVAGWSGTLNESARLADSVRSPSTAFGASVSISGNTVVVGAPGDDANGGDRGAAYVFEKPSTGWFGTQTESARLEASDGLTLDTFGTSVSVSGNTILIGTPQPDGRPGAAYVFARNGTAWSEQAKLLASDRVDGNGFGFSSALSGNIAVVGADEQGPRGPGSAYVFEVADPLQTLVAALTDFINSLMISPQHKTLLLNYVRQIPTTVAGLSCAQKSAAIRKLQLFKALLPQMVAKRVLTQAQADVLAHLADLTIAALTC
jgi:hypothetical protein